MEGQLICTSKKRMTAKDNMYSVQNTKDNLPRTGEVKGGSYVPFCVHGFPGNGYREQNKVSIWLCF